MAEQSREHINLLIGKREIGFYGSLLTEGGIPSFRIDEPSVWRWGNGETCTDEEIVIIRKHLEEFLKNAGIILSDSRT